MKSHYLHWTSIFLSAALLGSGFKLYWVNAASLTTMQTLLTLVLLTGLVSVQIRLWKIQHADLPEIWKRETALVTLSMGLMLGFGLWLATSLLKR